MALEHQAPGHPNLFSKNYIYNTPETHTTNRTRYLSALNHEFLVQPTNGRKKLLLRCKMCHKMCHKRTMQSLESIFLQSYLKNVRTRMEIATH